MTVVSLRSVHWSLAALWAGLLGYVVSGLAVGEPAEGIPDTPAFAFEQCASACQRELDQGLPSCDSYAEEEDDTGVVNCRGTFQSAYQLCINSCPASEGTEP